MLIVRNQQLAAFREELKRKFEQKLIAHAKRNFPDVCLALDERLGDEISNCVRRGQKYGFNTERELCRFLNLMWTFGRDFDRDPACAWAAPILQGDLPAAPKMDRLYAEALDHEHEARGYFALIGFQDA